MFFKTQTIPFRGTLMSGRDVVEELVVYNSFVTSDVSRAIFFSLEPWWGKSCENVHWSCKGVS